MEIVSSFRHVNKMTVVTSNERASVGIREMAAKDIKSDEGSAPCTTSLSSRKLAVPDDNICFRNIQVLTASGDNQ